MSKSQPSADIGIDLGTTYSVLAIKGRVELDPGYQPGIYYDECDVTVIPTPEGDPTFPSVFWVDPADATRVVIGVDAKRQADEGGAPIMFSKRAIGTDTPLPLHDRTYTAKEVAGHILRYMKACAERALGRPVRRAVITHPAYFERSQVEETRAAALAAGFDMGHEKQMMMEPAAAALAFTQTNAKDPLTVLAYDLGGGTFDVTVLERRQGIISIKAYDGDHLLGGYNFDRALVQWVLDRLEAKGRRIPFHENNPEDRARRARMLQLAENVKIKLSEQRGSKVNVEVRAPDILVDAEGRKVQILERLNREEYAALIKTEIDKTIACCHSALAKAARAGSVGEVGELDEIMLVGGSTCGPWIVEAVSKAFGREVRQFNPDVCVALGAALVAATLPQVGGGDGYEVIIDVPASHALPQINVAGTVRGDGGAPLDAAALASLQIVLRTPATGTLAPVAPDPQGRFIFEDVALLEESASEFRLDVVDAAGHARVTKDFAVTYAPESAAGTTEIYSVLPKPVYLKTRDGFKSIAEEGVQLPARCEIKAKRLHDDDTLDIEVYQEDEKVGDITITGIPPDVGRGATVNICVEITQHNTMQGTATVERRTGGVAATGRVSIPFPPIRVPDEAELRAEFDALEAERQQAAALSQDGDYRMTLVGAGRKLVPEIQKKFKEGMGKDRQEIQRALKEFRKIVQPPPDDMKPPRAHFRRMIEDCQEMLASKGSDPQVQPMQAILKRIETKGNDACTTKNHKVWAAECENLASLHERLQKVGGGGDGGKQDEHPTPILKDWAKQQVDQLRMRNRARREELEHDPRYHTRFHPRLEEVETKLTQLEIAIDKIDDNLPPGQGRAAVQLALRPRSQIEEDIKNAGESVGAY